MSFIIHLPKYRDILGCTPMPAPKVGLAGEFKIRMYDANERFLFETPWQKNLVTNEGLDGFAYRYQQDTWLVGPASQASVLSVGTGTATPAFTDTELTTLLASVGTSTNETYSPEYNTGAPDYAIYKTYEYRFGTGTAVGTINEVGLRHSTGVPICTHSLVTPGVPKTTDQIMDVFYRLYMYPSLTDQTGQITIDGVLYDFTVRGCGLSGISSNFYWGYARTTQSLSGYYGGGYLGSFNGPESYPTVVTTGYTNPAIGGWGNGHITSSYVSGQYSYTQRYGSTIDQFACADTAGLEVHILYQANWQFMHKVLFLQNADGTSGIPKDDTNQFWFDYDITWGRH